MDAVGKWATPLPGGASRVLRITKDGKTIDERDLTGKTVYILGRNAQHADVVLDHQSLSRRHAALAHDAQGKTCIVDLESTHGTRVNGVRLPPGEKVVLTGDDVFTLGGSTREFRVVYDASSGMGSVGSSAEQQHHQAMQDVEAEVEDPELARMRARMEREAEIRASIASLQAPPSISSSRSASMESASSDVAAVSLSAGLMGPPPPRAKGPKAGAAAAKISINLLSGAHAHEIVGGDGARIVVDDGDASMAIARRDADDDEEEEEEEDALASIGLPSGFGGSKKNVNYKRQRMLEGPDASAELEQAAPPKDVMSDEDDAQDQDQDEEDEDAADEAAERANARRVAAIHRLGLPVSHEVVMPGHSKTVSVVSMDPGGARCITGSLDYTLRVYDFGGMDRSHRSFREITPEDGHPIRGIGWSPSGDRFVVATGGARPRVYDRDGQHIITFIKGDPYIADMVNTKGHVASVTACCWHPTDKEVILTASLDGSIRWWNLKGKTIFEELCCGEVIKPKNASGQRVGVTAASISPDGRAFACGCDDGSVQVFNVKPPGYKYVRPDGCVRTSSHAPGSDVTCVVWSPDGTRLVSRASDDTLRLWNAKPSQLNDRTGLLGLVRSLPNLTVTTNAAWSPDGRVIVAGTCVRKGEDGRLLAFDVEALIKAGPTGIDVGASPAPPALAYGMSVCKGASAVAVAWHPKINQIIVGCGDGASRVLYDPARSTKGALLSTARAVKRRDAGMDFLADGEIVPEGAIEIPNIRDDFRLEDELSDKRRFSEFRRKREPADTTAKLPALPPKSEPEFVHKGARSFTQHYMKTHNKVVNLRSQDPAAVLRGYSAKEDTAKTGTLFTAAYKATQPKTVLAETTIEAEHDAEAEEAAQGGGAMSSVGRLA